jgi:hypothetical protein
MPPSQPTTIRLPKDLKLWFKKRALREKRTFSMQLIMALQRYRNEMMAVDRMLTRPK